VIKLRAALRRGSSLREKGDQERDAKLWQSASQSYEAHLRRAPHDHAIWVQYGHTLKEQGKYAAAEAAYRKALKIDGSNFDTYLQLGHTLKLSGELGGAFGSYLTALRLNPKSEHAGAEIAAFWPEAELRPARRPDPADKDTLKFQVAQSRFRTLVDSDRLGPDDQPAPGTPSIYSDKFDALYLNGLTTDILDVFDHEYYFSLNFPQGTPIQYCDRYVCLLHFCTVGIEKLLPVREDACFEAGFYLETYLRDHHFSAAMAYRHWLNAGAGMGWRPNRTAFVRSVIDLDVTEQSGSGLDRRLGLPADPNDKGTWKDRFLHFIEDGILRERADQSLFDDHKTTIAAARRFQNLNQDLNALRLYERVLSMEPEHAFASLARAEILYKRGSVVQLREGYGQIVASGAGLEFHYTALADTLEILGDFLGAVKILQEGRARFPNNRPILAQLRRVASRYMMGEWQDALRIGRTGGLATARARLAEVCRELSPLMEPVSTLAHRPIRSVAILTVNISPQCLLYRVEQKAEHIVAAGMTPTIFSEDELDEFFGRIHTFDAVIFYRFPAWSEFMFAVGRAREYGLYIFYDIDDLLFTADFPDTLESYSGLIEAEEHLGLQMGVPLFDHAIRLCDYAIGSTAPLAEEMASRVRTGRAFIHRNAFSGRHEACAGKPRRSGDGPVTIFYGSGTKAHGEDFQLLVEPALAEVVRRFPGKVRIVLAGYVTPSKTLDSIQDHIETVPLNWDIEAYWSNLAAADINIAVLKRSHMTDAKSEIKWMEAAMFGVPSIVSSTQNYDDVIEDGVDGVICATTEEWKNKLVALAGNRKAREEIGARALANVRAKYSVRTAAANIRNTFASVVPTQSRGRKRTIVIVNVFYPPQSIGGATRVVHDNVRFIRDHFEDQFDVHVFTTQHAGLDNYDILRYVQDGVMVTAVGRPFSVEGIEETILDDRMESIFSDYIDAIGPDLIHFHCVQRLTASVVEAALAKAIPYIITAHDGWWISAHQFTVDADGEQHLFNYDCGMDVWNDGGREALDKMSSLRRPLFGAARVLAVSSRFADLYRQCGVPRVEVCENGVTPLPSFNREPSPDGRVRVGFVAGMHRVKGYHLVKLAFLTRSYSNLSLTIIDHGLSPGQRVTVDWRGTPVTFCAKVPEAEVGRLFAGLDVVLAPSIWPESFGLVTREAAHFGCWVVASDRGSIGQEVVEGENGHLVDVSSADDLINKLTMIDQNALKYLRPPAKSAKATRTSDMQAADLVEIYLDCIAAAEALVNSVGQPDARIGRPRPREAPPSPQATLYAAT
jgi:glycosyltransferase involved in cell wall biosynthesis/tetratricopeptide (TPR) repeat protein